MRERTDGTQGGRTVRGKYASTATCVCGCANMWHKPDCRINGCGCEGFVQATVRRTMGDASWMKSAAPVPGRRRVERGAGSNE